MRIAAVLAVLAGIASAETHPAWRLVPMAGLGYGYDGEGIDKPWNDVYGFASGVGGQATLYSPKEDSMGWALVVEATGDVFSGDIGGNKTLPDMTESGTGFSRTGFGTRVTTGPFYRMLGLWGNSGGLFGARWDFTDGDGAWYREDYQLAFGVYTEFGSDPWAREGVRAGLSGARLGGSETWSGVFWDGVVDDSTEWLTEGFEVRSQVEYWRGPVWARLDAQIATVDLRHRSEEGSTGTRTTWEIGAKVGYRFAWGDLTGFR